MIIRARAPLRIGLAGGGTDLPPYFLKHGGAVLNIAINRYAFTSLTLNNGRRFEAISLDRGLQTSLDKNDALKVDSNSLPLHLAVYRYFIATYNSGKPLSVSIKTYCDAPVGSGLGSSSTLVVSMVKAWCELFNVGLDDYAIAETAYYIERKLCGFAGGMQDHYSAACGGINFIEFNNQNVVVHPLKIKNWFRCELESSLLLHHVGTSRVSSEIIDDQQESISHNEKCLEQMHRIKACAYSMKNAVLRNSSTGVVEALKEGWQAKRLTSSLITNPNIEARIELAESNDALASKISGAGGGGFILFFVSPEKAIKLRDELIKSFGSETFFPTISDQSSEAWTIHQ